LTRSDSCCRAAVNVSESVATAALGGVGLLMKRDETTLDAMIMDGDSMDVGARF